MFKLTPVTSKIGHPSSNLTKTLLRYIHGISFGSMRLIFVELSCLQAKCWRTDGRTDGQTDGRTDRRTDQSNSRVGYTQPAQKWYFLWRHFSARLSFYIFNRLGYPRGSHEKYLNKIVGPGFEIYAIELVDSMSTDESWLHLRMLHLYMPYIDLNYTIILQ